MYFKGSIKQPSPGEYEKNQADKIVYRSSPAFSHQFRREGTVLWSHNGKVKHNELVSHWMINWYQIKWLFIVKMKEIYLKNITLLEGSVIWSHNGKVKQNEPAQHFIEINWYQIIFYEKNRNK